MIYIITIIPNQIHCTFKLMYVNDKYATTASRLYLINLLVILLSVIAYSLSFSAFQLFVYVKLVLYSKALLEKQ